MSDDEDEGKGARPESEEDTQPMPPLEPAAPVAGAAPVAPSSAPGAKPSLFDTGWDNLLGPKTGAAAGRSIFAPPAIAGLAPAKSGSPSFLPPTDKPRTSESGGAVSGEFGGSKPADAASEPKLAEAVAVVEIPVAPEPADVSTPSEDKPPQADAKQDDAKQDDAEQDHAKQDHAEPDDAEQDHAEQDHDAEDRAAAIVGRKAANDRPNVVQPNPEPEGGQRNLLLILGIAAAVVLAIVLVNNGRSSEPAGSSVSSRPNKSSVPATSAGQHQPQARPPVIKTHAADPRLEALREKQALRDNQAANAEQTTGEQLGDGDPDAKTEPETPEPQTPKPKVTDPRDPSLIPPGTPAENAKAFAKLPVSVSDGAPIGGIGRNGIHIDEIVMGKGRDNSDCDNPTREFSTAGTEYVNVCVRVVHPREHDTLRVIWEQDGTVTRRSTVGIPQNLHAYKTRSYLQMRPEYVGTWRVRIVPEGEDDTNLAVAEFTIE